jgi:hypothetical protein
MTDTVLARVRALKTIPIVDLKRQWRDLFGTDAPPYNRTYLESRLAYRIQEIEFGGLKPETRARLAALAEQLGEGRAKSRSLRSDTRLVTGTQLVREWQGTEHIVTATRDGFEYEGRPYKSLSAVARVITGTHWNGPLFFGLRARRGGRERAAA